VRAAAGVPFLATMFERFTGNARHVVVQAQEEARAFGHAYIGTEHLLLGVLLADGPGGEALRELGLEAGAVRERIAAAVGRGDRRPAAGQIPFAPLAKKTLELALREAIALGCNYIGTEHVLLGLVRENDGTAVRILLDFDADARRVRDAVLEKLPYSPAPAGRRRFGRGVPHAMAMVGSRAPRWEYRVERREALETDWLNELGADGWELAGSHDGALVFKRRCLPGSLRAAG
jgi:ATP-dependent Clp protease ATP-binding subunit ClpC